MTEASTSTSDQSPGLWARRNVLFAILIAGSWIVCWRSLATLLQVALRQEEYTYILIQPGPWESTASRTARGDI